MRFSGRSYGCAPGISWAGILLAGLLSWGGPTSVAFAEDCPETPELRIKISSTVLSVPRRYDPNVYGPDGHFVGRAKEICQPPDAPPIGASYIAIMLETEFPFPLSSDARSGPIWKVQVRIRELLSSFDGPQREYDWAVGIVRDSGDELSALPRKHGFIAYDKSQKVFDFYFSLPGTLDIPDSSPLLVRCLVDQLPSPDEHSTYGRPCSTPFTTVNDGLVVRYKFYDGRYPIEHWSELDAFVRSFVRSLVKQDQ